jgi:hypothetical protein
MISARMPATPTLDEKPAPFDWSESARQAAARIAEPQTIKEYGNLPNQDETDGRVAPSLSAVPDHHVGDESRIDTGEWLVWISDSCFIVLDPGDFGPPDEVMRGMQFLGYKNKRCLENGSALRADMLDKLLQYKKAGLK